MGSLEVVIRRVGGLEVAVAVGLVMLVVIRRVGGLEDLCPEL